MTYKGHIRNRAVVLDEPVHLPEGAEVTVEVRAGPGGGDGTGSDLWAAVADEAEGFRVRAAELVAQEIVPPTEAAIQRIRPLLATLRERHLAAPSRAVPDGEGGIVLEWVDPVRREMVRTVAISAAGGVEVAELRDNRLQSRQRMS